MVLSVGLKRAEVVLLYLISFLQMIVCCLAKPHRKDAFNFSLFFRSMKQLQDNNLTRDKTSLFFSKNTPHDTQDVLAGILGIPIIRCFEKYLGLPSFVGQSKK